MTNRISSLICRLTAYYGILFLLLAFQSCREKGPVTHVPADASWVIFADFKVLALEAFSVRDLFLSEDKHSGDKQTPENTGIDFLSKAVVFGQTTDEETQRPVVLVPLNEGRQFHDFCLNQYQFAEDAELGNGWIRKDDFRIFISEKLAIGFPQHGLKDKGYFQNQVRILSAMKEDEGLFSGSANFRELVTSGKGIGLWANLNQPVELWSGVFSSELLNGELVGSAEFQTGKIIMNARLIHSDSSTTPKLMEEAISREMLEKCLLEPAPTGIFALRVALKPLTDFFRNEPYGQTAEIMLAQYGTSLEDLDQTLTGEIAAMILQGSGSEDETMPEFSLLLGTRKNAASLPRKLSQSGLLNAMPDGSYRMELIPDIQIRQDGDFIHFSSAGEGIKTNPNNQKIREFLLDKPAVMAATIDFDRFSGSLPITSDGVNGDELRDYWKGMDMQIGMADKNGKEFTMMLRCRKETDNSLQNLLKCLNQISDNSAGKNRSSSSPAI